MITIDLNKQKKLSFQIEVSGVTEELKPRFILNLKDGSSLMFEGVISEGKIEIELPSLKEFKNKLNKKASLEIVSETLRFETWSGDLDIKEPPSIQLKEIIDVEEKTKNVKTIIEEDINSITTKPNVMVEEKKEKKEKKKESNKVLSAKEIFNSLR